MADNLRMILTNFSKGELSPLLEGRPDLAAFFEGALTIENWHIMRQGGVTRRPGLRFIAECKDHTRDATLIPFESSVDDAFVIEAGNFYDRFYKNKQRLNIEIPSPYSEAQLRQVHFTQSVDVLFRFHQDVSQRKTSRVTDTFWTTLPIVYNPPPSFDDDTDISAGATLTPGAVTGTNVIFTASSAVFLEADVGRIIVFGSSRATITGFGISAGDTTSPNTHVRCTILDEFVNIDPIPSGLWFLRLSPQATLDPDIKAPAGAIVTLTANKNAFRAADVGKFVKIYAGLVRVNIVSSPSVLVGELLSEMTGTDQANPPAAVVGSWSLEVSSWSAANGFPGTGEFFQGRLYQARTRRQPTTFWGSEADDFDKYGVGIVANKAIDYTMATKQLNQIQWLTDNIDLFIGTGGSEHRVTGGKQDEPIGGDVIPRVDRITTHGDAMIQPHVVSRRIIWVDRSRRQIFSTAFNLEEDGYDAIEITGGAEHITESKIRMGPFAFQKRIDPRFFFVREDGTLITLTYHHHEKVIGFTRLVTDGTFEAVATIPGRENDNTYVIVKRTILGQTKRYVEMLEDDAEELAGRAWTSCQTDSARVYDLAGGPTVALTGLGHLEGKTVDVIVDGNYRGQKVVTSAIVDLDEPGFDTAEVGLHYDSTLKTMRPAMKDRVVEGLHRTWVKLWVRLFKSMGGSLNGQPLQYAAHLGVLPLFTGDVDVSGYPDTAGTEGYITVKQDKPYPMTVLAVFGEIRFGDHG